MVTWWPKVKHFFETEVTLWGKSQSVLRGKDSPECLPLLLGLLWGYRRDRSPVDLSQSLEGTLAPQRSLGARSLWSLASRPALCTPGNHDSAVCLLLGPVPAGVWDSGGGTLWRRLLPRALSSLCLLSQDT